MLSDEGVIQVGRKLCGDEIVPQKQERPALIQDLHKQGHVGMNWLQSALVLSYAWVGMQEDIWAVVNACPCTAGKRAITVRASLKPTPMPLRAFELVGLDLVTLTRLQGGNWYLVVVQDYYTKWPKIQATVQKTAKNVAKFLAEFISRFGCPLEIITNRGKEFLGPVNELLTRGRIVHRTTSAYRP